MPHCAYCGTQVALVSYAACPSCGKPANGAPLPTVKAGTNPAIIIAVVVGVLLFVVAVVGILAAIAIPNLLTAMQRSKQKRTMADERAVAVAVEAYAGEHNRYPSPASLESSLVPKYVKVLTKNDGWGHPFRYECWSIQGGEGCDAYAIGSGGKDGSFERSSLREYEGAGSTKNFNNDIVFMNGTFVQYPDGFQVK